MTDTASIERPPPTAEPEPAADGSSTSRSRRPRQPPRSRVDDDGVALVTLDRPEALNALSFDLLDDARRRARGARCATRPAAPSSSPAPATRASPPAPTSASSRTRPPRRCTASGRFAAWDRIGGDPLAAHRRGPRLRPRRRLRAGDGVRHDRRRRGRDVRPARDPHRRHARRRRHAAADPGDRQGPGDGADPDRPDDDGAARPQRARPRHDASCPPRRRSTRRSSSPRASPRCRRWRSARPRRRSVAADERPCADGLAREREAFFGLFDTDDQAEGMARLHREAPARLVGTLSRARKEETRWSGTPTAGAMSGATSSAISATSRRAPIRDSRARLPRADRRVGAGQRPRRRRPNRRRRPSPTRPSTTGRAPGT